MVDYVEFPVDKIIAVHWEDDDDDEDPGGDGSPPYCGSYGFGEIVAFVNPGLISALPYGPIIKTPFIGTLPNPELDFETLLTDGNFLHPYDGEPFAAAPYGLIATSLQLTAANLTFTNQQLQILRDKNGNLAPNGWTVPMVAGGEVATNYTIDMTWKSSFVDPGDEVGLGMTHPRFPITTILAVPDEPFLNLGSRAAGAASFSYDFKYGEWVKGNIVITDANQFNPAAGGPVILWWMTRRKDFGRDTFGPWKPISQFMGSVLVGLGDNYTWEISATCAPTDSFPLS